MSLYSFAAVSLRRNLVVLYIYVLNLQVNMKGRDLLDRVFDHLNIVEKDYFGLSYQTVANKLVCMSSTRTNNRLFCLTYVAYLCLNR